MWLTLCSFNVFDLEFARLRLYEGGVWSVGFSSYHIKLGKLFPKEKVVTKVPHFSSRERERERERTEQNRTEQNRTLYLYTEFLQLQRIVFRESRVKNYYIDN